MMVGRAAYAYAADYSPRLFDLWGLPFFSRLNSYWLLESICHTPGEGNISPSLQRLAIGSSVSHTLASWGMKQIVIYLSYICHIVIYDNIWHINGMARCGKRQCHVIVENIVIFVTYDNMTKYDKDMTWTVGLRSYFCHIFVISCHIVIYDKYDISVWHMCTWSLEITYVFVIFVIYDNMTKYDRNMTEKVRKLYHFKRIEQSSFTAGFCRLLLKSTHFHFHFRGCVMLGHKYPTRTDHKTFRNWLC